MWKTAVTCVLIIAAMWIGFLWLVAKKPVYVATPHHSEAHIEYLLDDPWEPFVMHQGVSDLWVIPFWRDGRDEGKRQYSSWDVIANAQEIQNKWILDFFEGRGE